MRIPAKRLSPRGAWSLLFLLAPAIALAQEPTRVEVTKDNSIVLLSGEIRLNAGSSGQIRIKGNQHLVAMMFDAAALHYLTPGDSPGAKYFAVKSATLVACKGDAMIDGLTISTLQADWDEMKSNGLTAGLPGVEGWGYAGARFPAVTGGNAFSLVCQAPSTVKDGAYHWPVHPDLINALAVGAAYGLTLHEWSADYSRNPTIFSREQSGKKPYLLVTFGPADTDPEPPTDLKVTGPDPTAVRLSLRAPKNGFAYEVTVNGAPLPRWDTPFVRPGETQVIPIRDVPLKAGDPLAVSVVTVSRAGKRSAPAALMFISPPVNHQGLSTAAAAPGAARDAGNLAVIPLEDKYDAAGKAVGNLPADYLARNPLFDGQAVRLAAARGEVVGFQALVKGSGKVSVKCDLPGLRTEVYRAVYVQAEKGRRIPDPLVPVAADEQVALSADEATPVCVYVFVPFDLLTPGDSPGANYIGGALALSDGRKMPVSVAVRRFEIPREASFLCEMNGYGLPDKASEFYRLQEIAYDHRAHVNLLAYGHSSTAPGSAKSRMNMLMDMKAGTGTRDQGPGKDKETAAETATRRMDDKRYNDIAPGAKHGSWDDFTAVFGPYLSGTYFKNGHRGPVPAPGFYLTFHESWPLKCREFFDSNPDAYEAFKAKPVYAETFVNIMGDFLALARREGWTRTGFQFYCNNKGTLKDANKAPWILDEPASYWDYRALAYYGDLARQAEGGSRPPAFRYRIDISRPEFDRGQLAGKADLWVTASGAFHEYHRLVADRAEQTGERLWVYGTTNKVEETNRTVEAWVLDAYRGGAWGVVPWQTIDSKGADMTKADQLGLFIFTKTDAGRPVIRHSIRLAAYLAAEQTVEYLELARKKHNLTPGQMQAFIDHYLNLSGTVRSAYAEDAGTPEYGKVTPEAFRQLREAAAMMIEKP
jgi:hypothetical protein